MTDFSEEIIKSVWQKAIVQANNDPDIFRKDYAGAWIKRSEYGNRNSDYGWEIDHIKPIKKNGTDEIDNLCPLNWHNNVKKDEDFPLWKTSYSSQGTKNIELEQEWQIG